MLLAFEDTVLPRVALLRSSLTADPWRLSFPIPQVSHLAAALIGILPAVDRPDMRRIFVEVRSSDPKLFAVRIDLLP